MDAACIFLNDGIADAGVQPGSSLESIVQQLILLITNPGCVDAPGGVPGGGTVTFIDAVWPGNAITIVGGPISNSGQFVFNGNGTSNQYIDGQGNLQIFPSISVPVEFQTNGTPNSTQTLLNLVSGTGVTLTESGGSVTIDVEANVYTVDNGLSADPTDANNFQLGSATAPGAPLIHDTYIAGAQFRFEVNNTGSMFLQGNRVDIEGGGSGAMLLSTGGASENSVEVTGTQVAIDSTSPSATTKIFLDPLRIRIQTPLFNLKDNGDVLTLIDKTTGEVEYMPAAGILLQTDGTDNTDQELLNLVSGNGITLTNVGGDVTIDGPLFQTDGSDNGDQTLLNLIAGTGITLTEINGEVTIDADAPAINLTTNDIGGASTYDPGTGDLNIPIYQTQLDIQDEGVSTAINPDFLNFIGDAVTVTLSGTGADITITGGTPYVVANGLHAFGDAPGESPADPYLFHLGGTLVENTEINLDTTYTLDVLATTGKKMLHLESGLVRIGDIDDVTSSGLNTYVEIGQSFKVLYGGRGLEVNEGTGYWAIGDLDDIGLGTKIEIKNSGQKIEMLGEIGGTYNKRGFYQTYGSEVLTILGDIDSGVNGTQYSCDDVNELHSFNKRLQFSNYNNSTAYQSWVVDGTTYNAGSSAGVLNVDNLGNVFVSSGTALSIQVDGSPFSSSSLLNFTSSADIGVTDLGGGAIQFSLVTPIVTYTSDEGVYNDSNTFKLGTPATDLNAADFQEDRYIVTNAFDLYISGPGNTTTSGILNVSGGSYAIQGSGTTRGVTGVSTGGVTGSHGGYFEGFEAINALSLDEGGKGIIVNISNNAGLINSQILEGSAITFSGDSSTYKALSLSRGHLSTTPAQNFGINVDLSLATNFSGLAGAAIVSNSIITKWFDPASTSAKSQFEIHGLTNGPATLSSQFTILGGGTSGAWSLIAGQIKFDKYAAGAIYKPADDLVAASGFNLGIDANGNIWATDFSTSTGPVTGVSSISIGTLTNGAAATVTNPSGPAASINITGQNAYTQIAADSGAASANTFNSLFSVVGADGITTSVTNSTSPASDIITVTGPDKYLNFVTKNILGGTIATYTPTIWNDTLNIQAGTGITITNGGSANTIVISGGSGGPGVSNVTGVNGNGFTVGVTNGTTTPAITVGTSITGVLVGNGTAVSAVTGTGVMVFSGTGYTFQALPTVNNGALNAAIGTNAATGIAVQWGTATGFTANIATTVQYDLRIGPALVNLATYMTQTLPLNPTPGPGVLATRPVYIRKTGQDIYTDATPVTTFSPGTTGFTVTSGFSTATALGINENVVLGGVLNVSSGGTGLTTAPGNGQILIGNGTGYTVANISAGSGISVTNTAGGIQIAATGITGPSALNGLHIHALDGSIRLGSGTPADVDVITPLIERTDIRMNGQIYRLSNLNQGYISDIGFQIDDAAGQKIGYLGSSTSTSVTAANPPQSGFVFSGEGGTALTSYNGFYIDRTVLAELKVYSGFSSSVRQVIARSATAASNKLTQVGTWGSPGTIDSTFYEAIPSARTIQIGSTAGNNNWIKLDDANQRVDFNKSTIYASAYGGGAVTGTLAYLIGTDATGKFFEFTGRSISQITGNTGSFSAGSMASSTSAVSFSIQGSGTINTTIAGNVLTISNSATAFPYWSSITTAATAGGTGTVTGASPINPQVVGANNLQFNAGSGITLRTVAAALGSATGSLIEITNNGLVSLVTGAANAFSIVAAVGNPGALTLNIPYQWRNIAVSNTGAAIGVGTTPVTPNLALSALTFNGGPGITLNTDTGSRTVTISATGSGTTLPATNGVWVDTAPTPDEYRLGSNTDGPSTFTQNRFIDAQASFLQIKGAPTTGDGNGILKLLSSGAGRGLRVENTNASPDGAIYATSAQLTSTDAAPTGAIYGNSSGVGSAIVGDGSDTAGTTTRPAIFGKGYIGVKGHNTIAQLVAGGSVAGGVGVYGTSIPPAQGTGSFWGVVGSTLNATSLLIPELANVGTGVYGEAQGNTRGGTYGTASDLKTFAARFVINTQSGGQLPTTGTSVGIRSMNKVADVLQLVRLNDTIASSIGIGNAIVFNIEGNNPSPFADGWKAGRVGYKLEQVTNVLGDPSRFFVTTTSASRGERETLAIESTGQVAFAEYSTINVPPSDSGQFPPTINTVTGYTNYYDYSVLGTKSTVAQADQVIGRIDTLRSRHGQYDPATIVINGTTGYNASNMTVVITRAYFTSLNNIATVHVNGSLTFTAGIAGVKSFDMPLPIPLGASANFVTGDVVQTVTLDNYSLHPSINLISGSTTSTPSGQRYKVNFDTDSLTISGNSSPFSAIFTYKLI